MKKIAITLALSVLASGLSRGATAYEALQVIRNSRGDAILDQLVEVRGESGEPQPQSWTVIMNDPSARGGVREFVVSENQILSERTPLRGYGGRGELPPLDFKRLNLDSDGAFRIAQQQAVTRKIGFNTLDYTLRTNDASGAPMWVVRLFDYMGAPVGNLQVSAENGSVMKNLQVDVDSRQPPPDVTTSPSTPATTADEDGDTQMGGVIGLVERKTKEGANKVKNTTLRIAGTVQEFLTGERTIDRDVPEDEDE